jgi:hypothetical protein
MNVLGKLFNKKKTYPKDNKFEVLIIGEDKSDFQEMLGITDKRKDELLKLAFKSYKDNDLFTTSCQVAVAECTHINEVVFLMTILTKIRELESNPLSALLGSIGRGE